MTTRPTDGITAIREALDSIPRDHLVEEVSANVETHTLVRTYKHSAAATALEQVEELVKRARAAASDHSWSARPERAALREALRPFTETDQQEGPRCGEQHIYEAHGGVLEEGTACRCGRWVMDGRVSHLKSRWFQGGGRPVGELA